MVLQVALQSHAGTLRDAASQQAQAGAFKLQEAYNRLTDMEQQHEADIASQQKEHAQVGQSGTPRARGWHGSEAT